MITRSTLESIAADEAAELAALEGDDVIEGGDAESDEQESGASDEPQSLSDKGGSKVCRGEKLGCKKN
mgnify:CR=1 FL=1